MGYLDNSSITVDAVLTKGGRRLLARGSALNINQFCLSDTGVDYNLWNNDHPSGSTGYGEAIESLPQVEALPQGQYFMRNKLLTLLRGTTALPTIDLESPSAFITDSNQLQEKGVRRWSFATLNYPDPDQWLVLTYNRQYLVPVGYAWDDKLNGLANQFIAAANFPNAGQIIVDQGADGRGEISFNIAPDDTERNTAIIFVSMNTGASAVDSGRVIPKSVQKFTVK